MAARIAIYALTALSALGLLFFWQGAGAYTAPSSLPQTIPPSAPASETPKASAAVVRNSGVFSEETAGTPDDPRAALQPAREARTFANVSPMPDASAFSAEIERVSSLYGVDLSALSPQYSGRYHATAYCAETYPHICGGNGVTASGTVPTPGLTCASDWSVLPPGTWLYISDVGIRRVEDSGSAIKQLRLDINVDTHVNALRWPGFGSHHVWVLGG